MCRVSANTLVVTSPVRPISPLFTEILSLDYLECLLYLAWVQTSAKQHQSNSEKWSNAFQIILKRCWECYTSQATIHCSGVYYRLEGKPDKIVYKQRLLSIAASFVKLLCGIVAVWYCGTCGSLWNHSASLSQRYIQAWAVIHPLRGKLTWSYITGCVCVAVTGAWPDWADLCVRIISQLWWHVAWRWPADDKKFCQEPDPDRHLELGCFWLRPGQFSSHGQKYLDWPSAVCGLNVFLLIKVDRGYQGSGCSSTDLRWRTLCRFLTIVIQTADQPLTTRLRRDLPSV